MHIDASPQVHANQADDVFLRVGDKSKLQTFEECLQLNYDKGERYFEDKAVPDATIDDIDMDFVKELYKEGENSYWMRSIMFSKWWLPLLVIYLKDGKNYSQFYESQHFHEIYKEMKEDK